MELVKLTDLKIDKYFSEIIVIKVNIEIIINVVNIILLLTIKKGYWII